MRGWGLIAAVAAMLTTGATPPPAPARAPQIALTFDDLPAHGPLPVGGDRLVIAQRIIAALAAQHAPATGFVNGGFGAGDAQAGKVIAAWRRAGLPIGNHTFGHVNLDQVGAPAFLADADRNEAGIKAAAGTGDWHWFRYPFLAEGQAAATRDAVRSGLKARGYRIAAVTMSFGDYAWNDAFARCTAKQDAGAVQALEASYLAAARAQAQRSRDLAKAAMGHDIPYVLLLHLGAFDARMAPRLLALYRSMGFGFTTLAAAEADPFYAAAVDPAKPGPTATLEAAARAAGKPVPADAPLPPATLCT
ncbi:polysaccharide deacetylase family protein [Sphingomonas sp. RIT328]|uniref:polysaccharide deacetylase family protein n=1 Tax=Sphingomonas sp. RIT328 TaxID=1470591 RepID=UPI000450C5D3|nr:polysaccharide deacetylase family protein [Sphingomonas sp. RIT328]EZP53204.1 Polysaccharide deacetylase [Sphingomonas sp. RIT328]